jgi:hypothetical protein
VTATALSGLLDPAAGDPPPLLEPVERGVERRQGEGQRPVRPLLDAAGDLVAVQVVVLDQRQDQQLGAAAFRLIEGRASAHAHPPYV